MCALHQLSLQFEKESELNPGLKQATSLLKKVKAQSVDEVTLLDISPHKNQHELIRNLASLDPMWNREGLSL